MKNTDVCYKDYLEGKITRRDFIRNMIYLGVSMSAITSMLTSAPKALAATPTRGGRIRLALSTSSPSDTFDPPIAMNIGTYTRLHMIYNPLLKALPDLTAEPEIAESWDVKPGAKEWIFKIRKGVEFHNGKSMTASDVIYSIQRHMDPKSKSVVKALFDEIDELKVQDKHTLYIRLKSPNVDLPMIFTESRMQIIPEGFVDFNNPVGTGPFKIKEWKPGVRCIVVRNPNYWRKGLPYVDEIESFGILDPIARTNALLAGDVDVMMDLPHRLIPVIEKSSNAKVIKTEGGRLVSFVMQCNMPPFDNPDVRLAMKYLIDREQYVKSIYSGYAEEVADQPISRIDQMYCHGLKRPYDPDKAKFHLKKAGHENLKVELHTSETPGATAVDGALLYQQHAAKGGVTIDVKREPSDAYWDRIWRKKPFAASSNATRITANMMLTFAYSADSPWNESAWIRRDFTKILLESRGEANMAKRKEMYCTMLRMISDDCGSVIPAIPHTLDAALTRVEGIIPNATGNLGGFKFAETVWLKS